MAATFGPPSQCTTTGAQVVSAYRTDMPVSASIMTLMANIRWMTRQTTGKRWYCLPLNLTSGNSAVFT